MAPTYVGLQLAPIDNNTSNRTKITKSKQVTNKTHTHTIYIWCGKGNMWSHRWWVRNMYLILATCTFYQCELVSIGSVSTLNVIKHFILDATALTQKGCTMLYMVVLHVSKHHTRTGYLLNISNLTWIEFFR